MTTLAIQVSTDAEIERLQATLGETPERIARARAKVGGAKNSMHVQGKAADIRVAGVDPEVVYQHCNTAFKTGGVGKYKTFTHVDCRNSRARW